MKANEARVLAECSAHNPEMKHIYSHIELIASGGGYECIYIQGISIHQKHILEQNGFKVTEYTLMPGGVYRISWYTR